MDPLMAPAAPTATRALTPTDYQQAMDSQAACNLSGIVFSFAQAMEKICAEAQAAGHDTEWRNRHPVCRLFAEQILHLTGSDPGSYAAAYATCQERAATPAST
jgi:hypothetical protein